jgi:hypothetical protein
MTLDEILGNPNRKEAYYQLVDLFQTGSADIRRQIVANWDFGLEWEYPEQHRLACSIGEQLSCRRRIEASLLYHVISANQALGGRERLVALAVIYHSCIFAGLDPIREFKVAAAIAPAGIHRMLEDFLERRDEDKSAEAFFLLVRKNRDGEIEIRPNWTSAKQMLE